tara:strand:- start:3310 stop:4095 length:786 start_codon:yes stop_codon:yes gene_type:complete
MNYAKKSLGQNFLIDKNIVKKIIDLTEIKNRNIIEIGPGKGALTQEILNRKPKSLVVVEKDKNLANDLKKKYSSNRSIIIYNEDILKFDLENKIKINCTIFGNLPFNISSQILVKILKFKRWPPRFKSLVFMFQKELAERILGKFPSKKYGRLSILSSFRLKILEKFLISPNCFFPKPKVDSMIIHFKPRKNITHNIKEIDNLEKVTNILFSNRRKMVNKNIKKILTEEKIKKISNLKINLRPADLSPDTYYRITELLEKH